MKLNEPHPTLALPRVVEGFGVWISDILPLMCKTTFVARRKAGKGSIDNQPER